MIKGWIFRKRFWFAIALLMFVVAGVIIVVNIKSDEVVINSSETLKETTPVAKLDFGEYKDTFSESDRQLIIETFSQQVDDKNVKGQVRAGSYIEQTVDNTLVKQVLVDVMVIKKTFLVYKTEGGAGGQNILYVRCAPRASQYEPSWECVDETE